jgi:hypothetical protein
MSRMRILLSAALLIVSGLTSVVEAQYRTSIQGVVTDPTGAVVPGATLTLTDPATGQKQVRTSNDVGVFNFNALAAETRGGNAPQFRLEVEKTGFKKKVLDNVQLIPEQANALNVELELGAESQSVTVNASLTPAIDTETASVNGVVSSNQVQHLPSFGRDVLKLAVLAPGVIGDSAQGGGGGQFNLPGTQTGGGASFGAQGIFSTENGAQVIAGGQQTENNGITIDGISTVSAVWGGTTVITPSPDSIDNVKIVSNSYDAEDGRFNGATLKITSKSGTNNFHGSLFITDHQPNLNAYQRFNGDQINVTKDTNKFHQFGGSIGGPIWKNKIFAFFNYESVREPFAPLQGNQWFDTAAFDALAPSGSVAAQYLSFAGNAPVGTLNPNAGCSAAGLTEGVNCITVPGKGINVGRPLDPTLFPLGQIGPSPGFPTGGMDSGWTAPGTPGTGGNGSGGPENLDANTADLANYATINPTKFTATQYNGRVDADLTANDRIGFAIYWVPQTKTNFNGNRGYDIFHHDQTNNAFSAIWNRTFSPTLLNELRVNAAGWRWNEVASNPQAPVGFPAARINQIGSITPAAFGPNIGSILNQWTYSYKDVATKIMGRHTLKFGADITRLHYLQDCIGCGIPGYDFFNMWDFLNDVPHNESGGFNPHTGFPTTLRQDDRENILGFFVQDDLKLRPNLTLNLGLRWSYFGPLYSKEDNMLRAFPGAGGDFVTGLAVRKANSWNAQKDNFSPQIGFAWSPSRFNAKLVFRGGYGLSYNQEEIALSSNIVNNPGSIIFPGLFMSQPTSSNPGIIYALSSGVHNINGFPQNPNTISTNFGANGLPITGTAGVVIFPNDLPTMRVHHYSFDMQYDLGRQYVMSLGYQGSLSRHILFHEAPNALAASLGYSLNPNINGCCSDFWNSNGYANYNAMVAELKHQFSHQFMADVQYTWARSMDTSSGPYFLQPYPFNLQFDYGRSDYNVTNAFKLYGMWQPVFFHGNNNWIEKIVGGWSLSGIFNIHSGFPWSPLVSVQGGQLYCNDCFAYGNLFPGAYLGGAGTSTSSDAFKTVANSNFPKPYNHITGTSPYFSNPTYTAYNCAPECFGNANPQSPGVHRNSFTLPGYKALDLTIAKAFGLPNMRVLGENAKVEFRLDAYNVLNNMNLNPSQISNNIASSNFGTITGALAARVVTYGARFSF